MHIKNFIARNIFLSILSFFAIAIFTSLVVAGFDLHSLTTKTIILDVASGLCVGTLFYFHQEQEKKRSTAIR